MAESRNLQYLVRINIMRLPLKKIDSPSTPPLLTQRLTTQETLSRNLAGNRMENVSWKNTRSEKP